MLNRRYTRYRWQLIIMILKTPTCTFSFFKTIMVVCNKYDLIQSPKAITLKIREPTNPYDGEFGTNFLN